MTSNRKLLFTQMPFQEHTLDVSAVVDNGQIAYLHCEDATRKSLVGNIYTAKVVDVVPTIRAAFVKFQQDQKAFLPLDPRDHFLYTKKVGNPIRLNQGDEILVQIIADPLKTKDAKATSDLSLSSDHCILTTGDPKKGASKKLAKNERARLKEFLEAYSEEPFGLILRTNCKDVPFDILSEEIRFLKMQYEDLLLRGSHATVYSKLATGESQQIALIKHFQTQDLDEIITDQGACFQEICQYLAKNPLLEPLRNCITMYQEQPDVWKFYGLKETIERALQKRVWLKHGGYLVIEETEAMNVVDVNSGKDTRKKPKPSETLRINKEAAEKIAEEMRLRELSGMILIDFINMDDAEDREELLRFFRNKTKGDFNKVRVLDYTKLGLVEVTREKKFPSLKQLLT